MNHIQAFSLFEASSTKIIDGEIRKMSAGKFYGSLVSTFKWDAERGYVTSIFIRDGKIVIEYYNLGELELQAIFYNGTEFAISDDVNLIEADAQEMQRLTGGSIHNILRIKENTIAYIENNYGGDYAAREYIYMIAEAMRRYMNSSAGSSTFTADDIRATSQYKEIIALGAEDITTPLMNKRLNLKFDHPLVNQYLIIYQNGTVRVEMTGYYSSRHLRILKKFKPAATLDGYIEMLDYCVKYLKKLTLKEVGITSTKELEMLSNKIISGGDYGKIVSDLVNQRIAEDPGNIEKYRAVMKWVMYNPDEFAKIVKDADDFGLI